MSFRTIEIYLPDNAEDRVRTLIQENPVEGVWYDKLLDDQLSVKILVPSEKAEKLMDIFAKQFSYIKDLRIVLLNVEATIPLPEKTKEPTVETVSDTGDKKGIKVERISRQELYSDIKDTAPLTKTYVVMVVLSAVVAAIGIMRSNVAIVIGAMVIAPLLGPNVSLSLATTLGDIKLAYESLKTNIVGIVVASVLSISMGFFLNVDPTIPEISSRTAVSIGDIILALASGTAGALAFTTGLSATLIGVMVAVALLPPLVTFGLLLGAGYVDMALGALLVFFANFICVNLSGVVTFLIQDIRPLTWWEERKARKATFIAITVWTVLLLLLISIILLSQGY